MKFTNLNGMLRAGFLILAVLIMTASSGLAQANNNNNRNDRNDRTENTKVADRDDDTDWGWLGLLGLLGLAGLLPKKRAVQVQEFRDTQSNNTTTGTGTTH